MLKPEYYWKVKKTDDEKVQRLCQSLHISATTAHLLVARGFEQAEDAKRFMDCRLLTFYDSMKMKGMPEAVARIHKAVENKEHIRIFGDYDADGVTSTAILARTLNVMGASVTTYIPNRFKNGYGPNAAAVEQAKKDGISLIVTVDSGIAAHDAAECAARMGIDYIITDHHEPPEHLPDASIIVNPKQTDCSYPFKGLSGAGIALKLAQALCPRDSFEEDWIALAAIGTIADLVPLVDENRLIAYRGLKKINEGSLPGIDALKTKTSGGGNVDSDVIGFQLAPRINAAGRLDDARAALELLLTESSDEAAQLADHLDALNQERRSIVDQIAKEADEQAAYYIHRGDKALVLAGKNWNQGVIGIAASKIVGKYYRPVVILSVDERAGTAKGSGRSIEGFNLYQGLKDCAEHVLQFGGHQMAAGLTVAESEIDDFRMAFAAAAERMLQPEDLVPTLMIDGSVSVDALSVDLMDELNALAPYGTSNPRPLLQVNPAPIAKISAVGNDKKHLKLSLKGDNQTLDAIGFGLGERLAQISPSDQISVACELGINEWNGFRRVQLFIRDLRVDGIQVYDWRSAHDFQDRIRALMAESVPMLAFQQETETYFRLAEGSVQHYEPGTKIHADAVAFLDLPGEEKIMADFLAENQHLSRFYCIFYHSQNHYFSVFPEREHFVWYYALIRQRQSFELRTMIRQIAGYKGWSEHLISLMTQVFFELGFVKIEKGFLTINPAAAKTSLTESETYRREKTQRELEAALCYSPVGELKQRLIGYMKTSAEAL